MARRRTRRNGRLGTYRPLTVEALEPRRLLTTTLTESFVYPTFLTDGTQDEAPVRGASVIFVDVTQNNKVLNASTPAAAAGDPDYLTHDPIFTNDQGIATFSTGAINQGDKIETEIFTASDPGLPVGRYTVVPPPAIATTAIPTAYSAEFITSSVNANQTNNLSASGASQISIGVLGSGSAHDNAVAGFAVFDSLTTAAIYGDTLADSTPGVSFRRLTVQFPAAETSFTPTFAADGSLYSGTIQVASYRAYSYGSIAHEFGHYMAAAGGFYNRGVTSKNHTWGTPIRDAGGWGANLAAAMNEGFADYYAVAAALDPDAVATTVDGKAIIGEGGTNLVRTDFSGYAVVPPVQVTRSKSISDPAADQGIGPADEATIARVMYALDTGNYDSGGFDTIALSNPAHDDSGSQMSLWQALVSAPPATVIAFVNDLEQSIGATPSQIAGVGVLLGQNFTVSQIGRLPATVVAGGAGAPPVFTWTVPTDSDGMPELDASTLAFLNPNLNYIVAPALTDTSYDDSEPGRGFLGTMSQTLGDGGSFVTEASYGGNGGSATFEWQPSP